MAIIKVIAFNSGYENSFECHCVRKTHTILWMIIEVIALKRGYQDSFVVGSGLTVVVMICFYVSFGDETHLQSE